MVLSIKNMFLCMHRERFGLGLAFGVGLVHIMVIEGYCERLLFKIAVFQHQKKVNIRTTIFGQQFKTKRLGNCNSR